MPSDTISDDSQARFGTKELTWMSWRRSSHFSFSRSAAPAKSLTITSSGKWNSMKGPLREPPSEALRDPEANLRGDPLGGSGVV